MAAAFLKLQFVEKVKAGVDSGTCKTSAGLCAEDAGATRTAQIAATSKLHRSKPISHKYALRKAKSTTAA